MAFSQALFTATTATLHGADLIVTWTSSDPDGTIFQVYVNRVLAWHGTSRTCVLPTPAAGSPTRIDVGAVGSSEGLTDLSASLPTPPGGGNRVRLAWVGGSYLGADIAGYHVYAGTAAGGAVSYATPVASIPAYIQGIATDGYGVGGYGQGGYGSAPSSYSWTSGPLSGGTWNFAVKSFDEAGNEGTPQATSAVVAAPPSPPAADADGRRLTYTYNATSHAVTLHWLASP
jgi:hypothetical protein